MPHHVAGLPLLKLRVVRAIPKNPNPARSAGLTAILSEPLTSCWSAARSTGGTRGLEPALPLRVKSSKRSAVSGQRRAEAGGRG